MFHDSLTLKTLITITFFRLLILVLLITTTMKPSVHYGTPIEPRTSRTRPKLTKIQKMPCWDSSRRKSRNYVDSWRKVRKYRDVLFVHCEISVEGRQFIFSRGKWITSYFIGTFPIDLLDKKILSNFSLKWSFCQVYEFRQGCCICLVLLY